MGAGREEGRLVEEKANEKENQSKKDDDEQFSVMTSVLTGPLCRVGPSCPIVKTWRNHAGVENVC